MENKNTIIAIAVSALISSVCTAAVLKLSSDSISSTGEVNRFSDIQSQIEQLKSELSLETQARVSLQQQLGNYRTNEQSAALQSGSIETGSLEAQGVSEQTPQQSQQEAIQRFREERRAERLASQQPGYRQQQLVSAGFAQEEAARIVQIESEESLRQLQAQYDFRRQRGASNGNDLAITNPIRAELGDQNYERYLEANGWPTSAHIGSIIGGSAGQNAGLRAGDNVISYAGERVFNLSEINNLTIQGEVGESVLIEVERNGESVQLTIPRGPIGINGGGRGRFRR